MLVIWMSVSTNRRKWLTTGFLLRGKCSHPFIFFPFGGKMQKESDV